MKLAGVQDKTKGRAPVTTRRATQSDPRPDLVQRYFSVGGPNQLWVADITYVRTRTGFVYTAFVTDVFSRMIVGWSTRSTMRTDALPLEALDQAISQAKGNLASLVHHSDSKNGSAWSSRVGLTRTAIDPEQLARCRERSRKVLTHTPIDQRVLPRTCRPLERAHGEAFASP